MNSKMERLSYEVYRPIEEKSKKLGIELRWAGQVKCHANFELDRYHGRYLLIYTYEGLCYYDDGEHFQTLEPGSLILYTPNHYQHYKTHETDLLKYYGLSFSGEWVDQLLNGKLITEKNIHYIGVNEDLKKLMYDMIEQMMIIPNDENEIIWSYFLKIIAKCNDLISNMENKNNADHLQRQLIKKAKEYICLYYNHELKINEIAEISGYSISWFEKLFEKFYGMSPINYQRKIRIEKAQNIINTDLLSLSDISYSVGFNDPFYFSKIFKKYTGISPREYKKIVLDLKRKNASDSISEGDQSIRY